MKGRDNQMEQTFEIVKVENSIHFDFFTDSEALYKEEKPVGVKGINYPEERMFLDACPPSWYSCSFINRETKKLVYFKAGTYKDFLPKIGMKGVLKYSFVDSLNRRTLTLWLPEHNRYLHILEESTKKI